MLNYLCSVHTAGHSYYEVIISTGEEAGASTFDRGVYFVLEGTKGATGKQYVRKLFSKAATKGATDVLQLEANSDLGDLLVATVGSDEPWVEMLKKPWFVEYIAVHNFQSRETMTFPCYHWITSGSWMSMVSRTSKSCANTCSYCIMGPSSKIVEFFIFFKFP